MQSEEDFVSWLRSSPTGNNSSIGDDCAIIPFGEENLLLTVDSIVESVHYPPETSLSLIAEKLVRVNLSDIAAMGGTPKWALLADGSNLDLQGRKKLTKEISAILDRFGVSLSGGDISGIAENSSMFQSLTLIGVTNPESVMKRNQASPGDKIAVTGTFGGAAAGRTLTQNEWDESAERVLFKPRIPIKEAQNLAEHGINCAIDVSDGLLKDLNRICQSSSVGAEVNWKNIPVDPMAKKLSDDRNQQLEWTLNGGEDFQLIFAIPPEIEILSNDYTIIGEFTESSGIDWNPVLPGNYSPTSNGGYDHFQD